VNTNDLNPWPNQRWPQLDEAALYGLTGEVVKALLPYTEADPVALAIDFLCGFGVMAATENGPWPYVTADGVVHTARLNALIVGDTARARKSTAFYQIKKLFGSADPDFIASRVLSGFGSGEALIDDVAESPDKRLWICEHEFSRVLVAAGREGSILSHIFRQAWDGDRLEVRTRKKRAIADTAHVAVLGHITLEEFRANVRDTDAASGFLNRFLIVCARRSQILPSGGQMDDGEFNSLTRQINLALSKARGIEEVTRSQKADKLWDRLYREMGDDLPGGLLEKVVARSEAQVLRLSAAYALTDSSPLIKLQHLRAAWAMWSYCRDSAAYVIGRGVVADTIYIGLVNAGRAGLSKTDLHGLLGRHRPVEEIDRALNALEREGCSLKTFTSGKGGGRPQTRFRLTGEPDVA